MWRVEDVCEFMEGIQELAEKADRTDCDPVVQVLQQRHLILRESLADMTLRSLAVSQCGGEHADKVA